MPKYHEISRNHLDRLREMGGSDLPVIEVDGRLLLPYERMGLYVDGMMYPSIWSYVKHTKNPLKIGRTILSMIIGCLFRLPLRPREKA